MTLEEALKSKLTSVLAALLPGGDIYPDAGPQPDAPEDEDETLYVVYQHAGDDNLITLDGQRPNPRIDLYTLDIYGTNRANIEAAKESLYDAFAGANCQGMWGGESGLYVEGAVASDGSADVSPDAQGGEDHDRAERVMLRIVWRK